MKASATFEERRKVRCASFLGGSTGGCASTQNQVFGFCAAMDVRNHIRNDSEEFFELDGL
jgi:hypothetical protein